MGDKPPERAFQCSKCHRGYKHKSTVRSHKRIGCPKGREREVVCKLCGKVTDKEYKDDRGTCDCMPCMMSDTGCNEIFFLPHTLDLHMSQKHGLTLEQIYRRRIAELPVVASPDDMLPLTALYTELNEPLNYTGDHDVERPDIDDCLTRILADADDDGAATLPDSPAPVVNRMDVDAPAQDDFTWLFEFIAKFVTDDEENVQQCLESFPGYETMDLLFKPGCTLVYSRPKKGLSAEQRDLYAHTVKSWRSRNGPLARNGHLPCYVTGAIVCTLFMQMQNPKGPKQHPKELSRIELLKKFILLMLSRVGGATASKFWKDLTELESMLQLCFVYGKDYAQVYVTPIVTLSAERANTLKRVILLGSQDRENQKSKFLRDRLSLNVVFGHLRRFEDENVEENKEDKEKEGRQENEGEKKDLQEMDGEEKNEGNPVKLPVAYDTVHVGKNTDLSNVHGQPSNPYVDSPCAICGKDKAQNSVCCSQPVNEDSEVIYEEIDEDAVNSTEC